jgi:peroxiredoxin
MDRLKPLFITAYLGLLAIITVFSIFQMVQQTPPVMLWFGVFLAALPPILFFCWLMLAKPARTSHHPLVITLLSALGVVTSMVYAWRYPNLDALGLFWAALVFAGWIIYVRWYSNFGGRVYPAPLHEGNKLPEFTLQSLDNKTVSSHKFLGKPHLLVFYRGNWCPLCVAQIHELAASYRKIEKRGAQLVMISSQPVHKSRELAQRFDIPVLFLVDPGNQAARQLGISGPHSLPFGLGLLGYSSEAALPTSVVTDATGKILFTDLTDNYRHRPAPDKLLKVLDIAEAAAAAARV